MADYSMLTMGTRALYGAGGAVYAVKEAAYNTFVLIFYTQVLGLDGSTTGIILAAALLWDAVSDPLVGAMSDRLQSRHGRRHPFLALSILPLGIGFVGLFSPPAWVIADNLWLAAWLLFWSIWVRTLVTTFSIPHLALSAEITEDYQERSQILAARLAFLFLFAVLLPALGLVLVFQQESGFDGRFQKENYPIYGALSCAVCWLMATITTVGTRRFLHDSRSDPRLPAAAGSLRNLTADLLRTLGNRSFRMLLGCELANMVAYGTVATLNFLIWTYYWEFSAGEISIILSVPSLIAVALVLATLGPLGRRFEKSQLLQLAMIGLIVNFLWLYPPRMLGLLPDNRALLFALNFIFMLVFMYCFLLRAIQTQSLIADIADEHEYSHGLRQEGGLFAAVNFINKFATVFGPVYGGIALDVIGLAPHMRPGSVPQPVLDGLAIALGIGALPGLVVALLLALRIDLGRARIAEVQAALRNRGS